MSKNKKKDKETTIEDYYDLKSDSIDELVAVLKSENGAKQEESKQEESKQEEPLNMNIAEITGEAEKGKGKKGKQFDPYKGSKLAFLPTWVKAIFIKWWFAGAVCFFMMFGTGLGGLDALVLDGVVLGVIVDILVNPIFRTMESERKEYNNYMMFPFPFKAFWTFFTNIIYYIVVMVVVFFCYTGLSLLIKVVVAVEPLLFGTFAVIADMIFIGIKDLIVYLVKKAKNKNKEIADV